MILGITGGTGSGKTTLARELLSRLGPERVALIPQDHYYLPLSKQEKDPKGFPVFDRPQALDLDLLVYHLQQLKQGKEVQVREYTFNVPGKMGKIFRLQPAPLVLVEGIFLLCHEPLLSLLDHCLYLDLPQELRKQRRFKRDLEQRNMSPAEMDYRWEHHVLPAEKQWLEPFQNRAEPIDAIQLEHPSQSITLLKQIMQEN